MTMTTKDKVDSLSLDLRHKSGVTANDFVREYCKVFRDYAYATEDGSINEFEKLITHVLGMYIYQMRRAEIIGLDADPRKFVNAFENGEEESPFAVDSKGES